MQKQKHFAKRNKRERPQWIDKLAWPFTGVSLFKAGFQPAASAFPSVSESGAKRRN